MTKVKAIMREYKYFKEDQPDQGPNVVGLVPLNEIIRYYVRDSQTSRLYGYEVGSISKAWHLVKLGRRYIVDSEVLDVAQVVANNERHVNIKEWLQSVQGKLGRPFLDNQAYRDHGLWTHVMHLLQGDDRDAYEELSHLCNSSIKLIEIVSRQDDSL